MKTKTNNIISSDYLKLHNAILEKKAKVGLALYEFCEALAMMHDTRAYLEGGYSSFEDYTLQALDIKKSQAYTYLNLYLKYSSGFFQENGKIGITKLQLLNNLSEAEATAFIQDNNVENLSVKQLKKTLAVYKDNNDKNNSSEDIDHVEIENVEENITYSTFGEFLKEKRLQSGLSQYELADILGISRGYFSQIELNLKFMHNLDKKIIRIFNLNMSEINLMEDLTKKYWKEKKHFKTLFKNASAVKKEKILSILLEEN